MWNLFIPAVVTKLDLAFAAPPDITAQVIATQVIATQVIAKATCYDLLSVLLLSYCAMNLL